MRIKHVVQISALCTLVAVVAFFINLQKQETHSSGFSSEEKTDSLIQMAVLGGVIPGGLQSSQHNNAEIDALAQFAVQEHNKKENMILELSRVVKAHEQVVAGTMHHLTLEVVDAGKKKLYEAKVWVKPWLNFKELQEFKHVEDVPSITRSDLGVKRDCPASGWQSVPVDDPVVQEVAAHAVKTMQQRSNSLFPYELLEIIHANAEVVDDSAKFDILLKVKRGEKEEKFKVKVHKNNEGVLHLNQMDQDHS